MDELGFWPRFAVAVLATWRISHLLAREDGPGDVLVRLRAWAGAGVLGTLLDCFYCPSLWVAASLAFFVAERPLDRLVAWLALSGAACLLERLGQQPVVFQPMSEGEDHDGMLRSEARGVPARAPDGATNGGHSAGAS